MSLAPINAVADLASLISPYTSEKIWYLAPPLRNKILDPLLHHQHWDMTKFPIEGTKNDERRRINLGSLSWEK